MCTLSWFDSEEGYELFFNRDESAARTPAAGPSRAEGAGVSYLAPTDTEAGGTWIAANVHGLTVALLNAAGESRHVVPESRGHIVRDLAVAGSLDELAARLADRDLARHRGFRLAAFGARGEPRAWFWDGDTLTPEVPRVPLASSSLGSDAAHAERRAVLDALQPTSGLDVSVLADFHRSHAPEPGPWSVCVHREHVQTVSTCHVSVSAKEVVMRYAHGRPCESTFDDPIVLARATPAAT